MFGDVFDGVVPSEQNSLGPELESPTPQTDTRRHHDTGRARDRPKHLDGLNTICNSSLQLFGSTANTRLRRRTPPT